MLKGALPWLALTICSVFTCTCMAQIDGVSYNWEMKRDRDNIQIYTSGVNGSKYKAVRGVSIMSGELESFVALALDFEAWPEWADLCKSSKQLEVVSATESFVYSLNDLPFPVSDRDAVALVTWEQNPNTKKVTMTSIATDSKLVDIGNAVRLKDAVVQWHFTPLSQNKVKIESFGHIDPNGAMPAWVTNTLLISSPFKSLKGMRRLIKSGKYDNAHVDFLD